MLIPSLWFAKMEMAGGDPGGNSNPNVNYTNTETQVLLMIMELTQLLVTSVKIQSSLDH